MEERFDSYRIAEKTLFLSLFKINDSYAGFTFAKGSEALRFDITAFFKFVMNGGAEFSCAASMDNSYLI